MERKKSIDSIIIEVNTEDSFKIRLVREFFGFRSELFEACNALQAKHSPLITIRFFIYTLYNGNNVGAYEFLSHTNISHVAICCSLDQLCTSFESMGFQ